MSTDTKPKAPPSLELHIDQSPGGEVAATVPVRWCVTPALIDELKSRGFVKPKMLLVVQSPSNSSFAGERTNTIVETKVQALPLEQELTYVSFSRPGKNTLRTVIVDVPDGEHLTELRHFANRTYRVFGTEYDTKDTSTSPELRSTFERTLPQQGSIDVVVPVEMFAPPPSGRRLKLVQRFFPANAVDQCHFRRRTIWSVVSAFLLLTVGQVFKYGSTLIGLMLGMRDPNFESLKHPWSATIDEPLGTLRKGPVWYSDDSGNWDPGRWPLWFLNPLTLTVIPVAVFTFMQMRAHSDHGNKKLTHAALLAQRLTYPGFWTTVGLVDLAIVGLTVAILAVVAVAFGLGSGVGWTFDKITGTSKWKDRKRFHADRRERRRVKKDAKFWKKIEDMTCGHASADTSLSALPADKRTVHLYYLDLKRQVCRPFAK